MVLVVAQGKHGAFRGKNRTALLFTSPKWLKGYGDPGILLDMLF